jgi:hypothetical protein
MQVDRWRMEGLAGAIGAGIEGQYGEHANE